MENIKSLLTVPYQQDNFRRFSANFLKELETVPLRETKEIPSAFKESIESYTVFGRYCDAEDNKIIVLSVKIKKNSDAQKAQRQFVSNLLINDFMDYNAALVAYYDEVRKNWKLSFVTIKYAFSENGVELKFQPAKRFSFLVGQDEPCKTYVQQLSPIYNMNTKPSLSLITESFSISRLSKDFYEDYKNKYFELYDYLVINQAFIEEAKRLGFEDVFKFATTFCKKTLGQIVFLHFVQKKGWLGVLNEWGDGDKQYLINSVLEFTQDNYFNDFLEPLFYNAFNIKRNNDYYLGKKIPFLNGGLFHPIEDYDWKTTNFNIPNTFWINEDETGLLNLLHQYNFTVDEADPEEQEIAIDPEMLGKIFESLLDTNNRSALGAFYTPREIVHFMCEESLAARLSKALDMDYDSILNYIKYGDALKETEFIEEFAEDIDEYISHFTVVDPAVGSGAFLVGMLNQIVKIRTNLQRYTNRTITKYQMKLEAIQSCLYGVDIEFDAVEIAKLRLWLSLIVDQEIDGNLPKPLPNLNFHLRVGNSLVDTFKGIKLWNTRWRGSKKKAKVDGQMNLFNTDTVESILSRLKQAKLEFFNTSEDKKKQKLLWDIERQQIELIRSELVAKGDFSIFSIIEDMISIKTKPFFIWELEFEEVFENGGFDIVIANPPYVQLQKDGGKLADELKDQGYETFTRRGDIYCIFYEKGVHLLKDKGVLSFITSNKWMRAGYGEKLRGFLAENSNPIKLIDFGGNKIFESATVDVNILLATKEENEGKTMAVTIGSDCTINLSDYIQQLQTPQSYYDSNGWIILSNIENNIKRKIEKNGTQLKDWNINIYRGILTGLNEAFIIDESTKNVLITADPKSADVIRPILRGRDIKKYICNYGNLYLLNIHNGIKNRNINKIQINDYLTIKNYLDEFYSKLAKRSDKGDTPYNLRNCVYMDDFFKQKIMYNDINKRLSFCLVDENVFCNNTVYFIAENEHMLYFLGLLNCKLIDWYYKNLSVQLGKEAVRMFSIYVKKIPIPEVDKSMEKKISDIVSKITENYNQNIDSSYLEEKIDYIVYSLYDLTEEEIIYIQNKY